MARKYLTTSEAAEYTSIPLDTMRLILRRGDLRHFKRHRRIFLDRADLDNYMADGRVEARA